MLILALRHRRSSCPAAPATPPTTWPRSAAACALVGVRRRATTPAAACVASAADTASTPQALVRPPAMTRRSRRGSSPAASTRPSSRSCGSIASDRARLDAATRRARRGGLPPRRDRRRRRARVRLRLGAGDAGSRGSACNGSWRARPARRACRSCVDSRHDRGRYQRPDGVHAERVGGRAAARRARSTTTPRVLERAGRAVLEATEMEAVLITRGSRGMALFEPAGRRVTSRSTAPTKSPT